MARRTSNVLLVGLALLFISPMLVGSSASGVELQQTPVPTQPGELPACHSVHTYSSRDWPSGVQVLRSDVWLMGCNNPDGSLRLATGPTCKATSFLGRGTATCTATPSGSSLKVTVHIEYPLLLNQWTGQPTTTTFFVDPSGSYQLLGGCLNNQGC